MFGPDHASKVDREEIDAYDNGHRLIHRCKKRFLRFFLFRARFFTFLTFFIFQRFLIF